MNIMLQRARIGLLAAAAAAAAPAGLSAQSTPADTAPQAVDSVVADAMVKGPDIRGVISARRGDQIQVATDAGSQAVVEVTEQTRVSGRGGFLGLGRSKLANDSLLNGLPVTIRTMRAGDQLIASQISLRNSDLKTANMIRNGTAQGFAEQTAATEALRGRVADIDQYNVKSTTNVNFDTGKAVLAEEDKAELCQAAQQADGMKNALLLVVGYTDSTGSEDFNQTLSERRASKVVNYLQQVCHWKPYRMLTPTGMAMADPLADNSTEEGKAQNRRVAVNVLVSKAVDGMQ